MKKIYYSNKKQNLVRYLRATIPEAHVQGFTCDHFRDQFNLTKPYQTLSIVAKFYQIEK